jgi:hypothetical protein
MISNYLPLPDMDKAPAIVRELREAFDERLELLHAEAQHLLAGMENMPTRMVHVPFAFQDYEAEAMYDLTQDLFTQVVVRPLAELENARPSFTVSLFLVAA